MAIFLDAHLSSDVPLESMRDFLRKAVGGTRDEFGVRPLDLYCGDDGRVFYVLAAPDELAVRQHHAAAGVVCGRIRHIQLFSSTADELSDAHKALVRQMIIGELALPATMGGLGDSDTWLRQVG
ncbi:MAG TPA: hypothetical protein VGQ62_23120, partial [Chloroflexota bacterium]|jgi:hypothetical protein|nr:hypothetical protein [Chloroflexota bacterium]